MSECVCVLCVVEEGWMRVERELHDSCMAVGMVCRSSRWKSVYNHGRHDDADDDADEIIRGV